MLGGDVGLGISKQVYIQTAPELIWLAWTSSDRITEWFAPMAIIEPEANSKFELYFNPSNLQSMNTQGCIILAYEPVHFLRLSRKTTEHSSSCSIKVGMIHMTLNKPSNGIYRPETRCLAA